MERLGENKFNRMEVSMKCVKSATGTVMRVTDVEAERLVKSGWSFTSKKEWKEKVRDSKKTGSL